MALRVVVNDPDRAGNEETTPQRRWSRRSRDSVLSAAKSMRFKSGQLDHGLDRPEQSFCAEFVDFVI